MKSLKYYFKKAQKENFAIPQFNFSDFTQVKGITSKAKELKSPVILGTSEGESEFFGIEETVAIRNVLRKKLNLPIFLNLDHGKSFDYIKKAIDVGYDMVHFDGSKLQLEENISKTKKIKKYARWRGVLVEGEVGRIGTESSTIYSEKFEIKEEDLTKPEEAQKFINKTGVDLLAVSIGNFHGIEVSGVCPNLKINILKDIKEKLPNTLFVLHGGSGIMEDDIKNVIAQGIVKININTEIRIAFSENLRKILNNDPKLIVPYKFLPLVQKSVEEIVEQKIKLLNSENKI